MEELKEEMLEYQEYIELLENDLKDINLRLETHEYYKEKLEEMYKVNNKNLVKYNLRETFEIVIIIYTFYLSNVVGNELQRLTENNIINLRILFFHLLNLISKIIPFLSLLDFSCGIVANHQSLNEYKKLILDTKDNLAKLNNSIKELNMTKSEILELIKIYNQIANGIEIQLDILNDKTLFFNPIYKLVDKDQSDKIKVLKFDKK